MSFGVRKLPPTKGSLSFSPYKDRPGLCVAHYHTHPLPRIPITDRPDLSGHRQTAFPSKFSDRDIRNANASHLPEYIFSEVGTMMKYDPQNMQTTEIFPSLPQISEFIAAFMH